MQTSLLLPLILIATTGPDTGADTGITTALKNAPQNASAREDAALSQMLEGCRSPVLDPRLSSQILYQNRLDAMDDALRGDLPDADAQPLFIARCGDAFVLFNRPGDDTGDVLFLKFEEGTFALVGEHLT